MIYRITEEITDLYEGSCLFHSVSQEWPKRSDKASLLTASGMLLHAFTSMFLSSLREFPENCVYKQGAVNNFLCKYSIKQLKPPCL
jgi:hypothetical protein